MAATSEPLGDWDPSTLSPTGVGISPGLPNSPDWDFRAFAGTQGGGVVILQSSHHPVCVWKALSSQQQATSSEQSLSISKSKS